MLINLFIRAFNVREGISLMKGSLVVSILSQGWLVGL